MFSHTDTTSTPHSPAQRAQPQVGDVRWGCVVCRVTHDAGQATPSPRSHGTCVTRSTLNTVELDDLPWSVRRPVQRIASSRVVEAACDRRAGAVPSDRPRPHNTVTCRIGHYSRLSAACNASSLSVASFF
jgi:hypothetical protein